MIDYLMQQFLLLIFAFVGFLFIFSKLATPEQKKALIPALKKFPHRFIYVIRTFIYQVKNKNIGGISKNEKIHDISSYRKHSRGLWRKK